MSETEYHIKFPKTPTFFFSSTATFSINHIKSRLTSVLYFKLHCYDKTGTNEIYTYVSPRWVINGDSVVDGVKKEGWTRRVRTFEIPSREVDGKTRSYTEDIVYTQIELIALGNDSENPLYFTECMLNEGEDIGYHQPSEHRELDVGFVNSRYVNLYNKNGDFMQVIRPQGDKISTNKLLKSTCTVIAPHFDDESDVDDPINVFMEFINQTEQRIDVLR